MAKAIELWADSFHEGEWCCSNFGEIITELGGAVHKSIIKGFQPVYTFCIEDCTIEVTVYGSYKSWSPVPTVIDELLCWGKPDFLAFDKEADKIVFAVEETAATPTGNQAMQRCERIYGSARAKIPFWFLLSEYGMHGDGGVRRDSIWSAVQALKLTQKEQIPCVVLHYSSVESPEDYAAGAGKRSLFEALVQVMLNHIIVGRETTTLTRILTEQYKEMLGFINSQHQNVVDYFPGVEHLNSDAVASTFAALASGQQGADRLPDGFLVWPTTNGLPADILQKQRSKPLIKHDPLCFLLERDLDYGKAYILSDNAGSGQPQSFGKIQGWVNAQRSIFESFPIDGVDFPLRAEDFPATDNGNRHMTTAKNIVYLYDRWGSLRETIEAAFPRLVGRLDTSLDERPAFIYISNSLKPGRIFGDPYTGQLSGYGIAFGKFDQSQRVIVAYFSHQSHGLACREVGESGNKGLTLMRELTDYLIFTGGVVMPLSRGGVVL